MLWTSSWRWVRRCPSHTRAPFGAGRAYESCARAAAGVESEAWNGRVGEVFVIAAVAPEAKVDPRGFHRGVGRALERLAEVEE